MKGSTVDGWTRLWVIVSVLCAAAALAVGLSMTRTPDSGLLAATGPEYVGAVLRQMGDPGCAKFREMRNGQFFRPHADFFSSEQAVSPQEDQRCGSLIDYRNTTVRGQGPAPSRELFLADVESFRLTYQSQLSEYRRLVFGMPATVFVLSWGLFFGVRPIVRWVRAGFTQPRRT